MINDEQRTKLNACFERMCDLSDEINKVCERAEALGELGESPRWGALIFNMGRAGDAALSVMGELTEAPKLKIFMTDPDEIIKRSEYLISAGEEYVLEVRFKLERQTAP